LHGPGLSQLGSYVLVTALACIGYGAVFLMCGILFRNPMIAAAVVWVWENLNPFLPTLLKKISVIFLPEESLPRGGSHPAALQRDGGGGRPHPVLDRGSGIAGGGADPSGVLRHFGAPVGNQLRE